MEAMMEAVMEAVRALFGSWITHRIDPHSELGILGTPLATLREREKELATHRSGARLRECLTNDVGRLGLSVAVDANAQLGVLAQKSRNLHHLLVTARIESVRGEAEEDPWEAWWLFTQVETFQGPLTVSHVCGQ